MDKFVGVVIVDMVFENGCEFVLVRDMLFFVFGWKDFLFFCEFVGLCNLSFLESDIFVVNC